MTSTIEITGSINIHREAYIQELGYAEDDLAEPRLLVLRRALSTVDGDQLHGEQANMLIESQLLELLRTYEVSIASDIQNRLTNVEGRRIRDQDPGEIQVSLRFSRGSLLYTLVITFLGQAGSLLTKAGLANLVVTVAEPVVLDRARKICHATTSLTGYVRDVALRSAPDAIASLTQSADDRARELSERIQKLIEKLDETRNYRQIRSFLLIILGLLMVNFVAVATMVRKVGLF